MATGTSTRSWPAAVLADGGPVQIQLHRAIGGSCMFMNYALWDSVDDFRAAFSHPDFVGALGAYPSSAVAQPHLFARVAVPNLCAA